MSGIFPVKPVEDYYRERGSFNGMKKGVRTPVDSKIQYLVLSQIRGASPCTLFASATSPHVVIDLIPGMALPVLQKKKESRKGSRNSVKQADKGFIPIGLTRCDVYPPINSILQLLLFIPVLRDAFSFAPLSYRELNEFIDQYIVEQRKRVDVSTLQSDQLLQLLMQKMPAHFFRFQGAKIDIKEFLCFLIKTVFGRGSPPVPLSLAFHLDWNVTWDRNFPFSSVIDLPMRPAELFVTVNSRNENCCSLIQRQFFTKPDGYCYDLDAFVEYRLDGKSKGDHITYLKSEGGWYQCDDERIVPMLSSQLNTPLSRSILLHYKRIWPK